MSTNSLDIISELFKLSTIHLSKMAYSYKEILHIPFQNILSNIFGYYALLNLQN